MRAKKTIAVCLAVAMCATIGLAAGCDMENVVNIDEYELSCYRGEDTDFDGKIIYNNKLFYDNAVQQGGADPMVLDDTARSGYYYLFVTNNNFTCWRSKNLVDWEYEGPSFLRSDQPVEARYAAVSNFWAPEVMYDEDTKLYYLFFSASPIDSNNEAFQKTDLYKTYKSGPSIARLGRYNLVVATSPNPSGPFMLVDFSDPDSCGQEAVRVINTEENKKITKEQAENHECAYMYQAGTYYEAAFPQFFSKFCYLSPDKLSIFFQKNKVGSRPDEPNYSGYWNCIDAHPYQDPVTGNKYIFFKSEDVGYSMICVVPMKNKNWFTPDWDNAAMCAISDYYTAEDWYNNENHGVTYEDQKCIEAPFVTYHEDKDGNGRYYLTFSVNTYQSSRYQVAVAVADNVLGPYRKLEESEGGLLLSSNNLESQTICGTGHHSFVTVGDQMYIVYHRHVNYGKGDPRYTVIDEVTWVTVEDKFGNPLDVPYTNGPTDSLQPLPDEISGYTNIAPKATVTCDVEGVDTSFLVDGLLSVLKIADEEFMDYIQETKIEKTATFTFDFGNTPQSMKYILIYQSARESDVFVNIPRIEFTLKDGSTRVVRDTKFDVERYCEVDSLGEVVYCKSGAAALVEFYDIDVKSVKITVEVPEGQERVGISEIRMYGKM